MIFVDHIK